MGWRLGAVRHRAWLTTGSKNTASTAFWRYYNALLLMARLLPRAQPPGQPLATFEEPSEPGGFVLMWGVGGRRPQALTLHRTTNAARPDDPSSLEKPSASVSTASSSSVDQSFRGGAAHCAAQPEIAALGVDPAAASGA
jgi:hypothetical protein